MSEITLYGPPQSSYMRTARWTCAEKGVAHEVVVEGFKERHPWGKIPSMSHGDFALFETSAICRYVDEAFDGPALMPEDVKTRAVAEQWISALNCYGYDALVRGFALRHFILPKLRGEEPITDGLADSVARLETTLDRFEAGFAAPWFAGDTMSLADLFLGPMLSTAAAIPQGKAAIDARPKLAAFLGAISDRPTYRSVQPG